MKRSYKNLRFIFLGFGGRHLLSHPARQAVRNAGLRIDHFLLSPKAAKPLVAANVDRNVRGWEKSSDHAPVWIELGE